MARVIPERPTVPSAAWAISGTSVCGYCSDGYWDRETEECDGSDPTDPNANSCSDSCEIIVETPTRTLGYWKNHPTVINNESGVLGSSLLPLTFCGETIEQNEVYETVDFLRSKGGGIGNFKRQGMAALLNCEAFICSQDIRDLINAGSSACAGGGSFDFGDAGSTHSTHSTIRMTMPRCRFSHPLPCRSIAPARMTTKQTKARRRKLKRPKKPRTSSKLSLAG